MYCFTLAARCRTIRLELNWEIPPRKALCRLLGEKRHQLNSLTQLWLLRRMILTCQAKCILLCNSGTTVLGTTKCSLISFEACTTKRKIHARCCKPGQNYTFGEGICLSGELTCLFSFLTKLIQHRIASHVCAHSQMLFWVFIRETSMCTGCRHPCCSRCWE